MPGENAFRLSEQTVLAINALADMAVGLDLDALPDPARARLPLLLTDLLGVTLAGMQTPELQRLVEAWECPPGEVLVPGTTVRSDAETSATLAAIACCCLELDEGNKYAGGHPAAHVLFAALAATRLSPEPVSGRRFLAAVVAGYEVAARFGQATTAHPAWHPHGHWGATGAACAATVLLGGSPAQVAAAIDAATGLMQVTPWATVLVGSFTRNAWMAGASTAGLRAARLAKADLVDNIGAAQHSLGTLVGGLAPDVLTAGLGERWLVGEGYFKQHSSCSYTHAAVDLVQSLRTARPWLATEVEGIDVTIHSLARPLLARHPSSRLAAMFSLPFVVSTAAVSGRVTPDVMDPAAPAFAAAEAFSQRVAVRVSDELDTWLPDRRCTEVSVRFTDGSVVALAQPGPIGDVHHFPFDAADIDTKISALVGPDTARQLASLVTSLPDSPDVAGLLEPLC